MGEPMIAGTPPCQAFHYGLDGSRDPEVTLLAVNTAVNPYLAAHLAGALADLLSRSQVSSVLLAAAVVGQCSSSLDRGKVYRYGEVKEEAGSGLPELPPLPAGARVQDPFLSALVPALQLQLYGVSLNVLLVRGYRMATLWARADGTEEALGLLGQLVASFSGLEFDLDTSSTFQVANWPPSKHADLMTYI
ncbi:unnamed protein product [Chrysoparadoxa australica]